MTGIILTKKEFQEYMDVQITRLLAGEELQPLPFYDPRMRTLSYFAAMEPKKSRQFQLNKLVNLFGLRAGEKYQEYVNKGYC